MTDSEQVFQCPECGLHYRSETQKQACEKFCSEFNACNLEITKDAIENEAKKS